MDIGEYIDECMKRHSRPAPPREPELASHEKVTVWAQQASALLSRIDDNDERVRLRALFEDTAEQASINGRRFDESEEHALSVLQDAIGELSC